MPKWENNHTNSAEAVSLYLIRMTVKKPVFKNSGSILGVQPRISRTKNIEALIIEKI